MDQEIKEGRGCGPNGDYVVLDLTHIGAETIMKRLPSVYEIGMNFANIDVTKEPIPVVPTIHYQMGGIPTNINGQVVVPKDGNPNHIVNGLYAIGECSCVSVHGANRLDARTATAVLAPPDANENPTFRAVRRPLAQHARGERSTGPAHGVEVHQEQRVAEQTAHPAPDRIENRLQRLHPSTPVT
jgi:succinate dehydrogenase/fumarate reductase flavoprotein subunit